MKSTATIAARSVARADAPDLQRVRAISGVTYWSLKVSVTGTPATPPPPPRTTRPRTCTPSR